MNLESRLVEPTQWNNVSFPIHQYAYEKFDVFTDVYDLHHILKLNKKAYDIIKDEYDLVHTKHVVFENSVEETKQDTTINAEGHTIVKSEDDGLPIYSDNSAIKNSGKNKVIISVGTEVFESVDIILNVEINLQNKEYVYYVSRILSNHKDQVNDFITRFNTPEFVIPEETKSNIYSIIQEADQLKKKSLNFLADAVSIEDNYNDDFKPFYDKLVDDLSNGTKGLYFLHGNPGTGKTKFIANLASTIRGKKFFFLPSHLASILTSPNFIPFIMDHPNSIILIEEAENSLIDRRQGNERNPAVANLLNLTDGILAESLKLQFVCTFNCDFKAIDPALTRKGRLKLDYEFKNLSVEKSNKLLKKLGFEYITDTEMTLADIYNFDQEASKMNKKPNKIGF